jgi:hypothetical protein
LGASSLKGGQRIWLLTGVVLLTFLVTHTLPLKILGSADSVVTTMQLTLSKTALGPVLQSYFGTVMFPKVEGSARTVGELMVLLARQFTNTIGAPVFFKNHTHYVFGPPLDIGTGILSLVGLLFATWMARNTWKWRLVLIFYIPAVILAGALTPYGKMPITRIHFLMPFWILFAVTGLEGIARTVGSRVFYPLSLVLIGFSAWTGFWHIYIQLPGTPHFTTQAYAIQLLQSFPEKKLAFLFTNWHPLDYVVGPYGFSSRVIQVNTEAASHDKLREVSNNRETLIVLAPDVSPEIRSIVRAEKCRAEDVNCDCRPCGGFPDRPLSVCGQFDCPVALPKVITREQ